MGRAVYYVEAPDPLPWVVFQTENPPVAVFLAGGITGCPDWQSDLYDLLQTITLHGNANPDLVVLNPRREDFPIYDPNAARTQIKWEFEMLRRADIISFWFCKDQIQPIVLFEYGYWLGQHSKPLVVGIEPGYPRTQDVVIQTELEQSSLSSGPHMMFNRNLNDQARMIVAMARALRRRK